MSARARAALIALLGALLLASLAAGSAVAATAASGDTVAENVTFAMHLEEDGDARWTVTARFSLDTAAEREAFADLADAYERGEVRSLGLQSFRNASNEASMVTGRSMDISEVRRDSAPTAAIENGTGWLSLSFTWTNFARVGEEGDLVVGDAFNTTRGTWLSRLGQNETLVIEPPESHNPFTGDCELTERSFRCTGPMSFSPGSPAWVFTADGAGGTDGLVTGALVVGGLLVLLLVVYILASRRESLPSPGDVEDVVPGDGADTDGSPAAGAEAAEASADGEDDAVDVELLSDEERVEHLLEQNGGRMKQASIVKETGWSNAKVSQLLSAMAEEGRIDKLRIGRENLISFPDEDLTDVDE